jgi:thiol-disulfide isomerase/thioredoxin
MILLALVAVGAVVAFAVVGLATNESSAARRAPALPSTVLVGPRVTVASLLAGAGGRPALVVFWASWCGPCEKEAAAIEHFAQTTSGHGRVAGVDWSDAASGARAFIKRFGWSFPNLRDGEGTVGNAYRITGLPTTFVIGAGGTISRVLRGPQDEGSLTRALAAAERPA